MSAPADTELYERIQVEIAKYPNRRSAILAALRLAQEEYGWLSPEALEAVSDAIDLSPAHCASVASFYDMFFLRPVGNHTIEVCTNISCALRGAGEVVAAFEGALGIDAGETTEDGAITLRTVECLGGCGWAPVVAVDERYLEHFRPEDAAGVAESVRSQTATAAPLMHGPTFDSKPRDYALLLDFEGDRRDIGAYEQGRRLRAARCTGDLDDERADRPGAEGLRPARPRRRRLPDRPEGELPRPGRGALPRRQRRRVRAGDVQGPRADAAATRTRCSRGS